MEKVLLRVHLDDDCYDEEFEEIKEYQREWWIRKMRFIFHLQVFFQVVINC